MLRSLMYFLIPIEGRRSHEARGADRHVRREPECCCVGEAARDGRIVSWEGFVKGDAVGNLSTK